MDAIFFDRNEAKGPGQVKRHEASRGDSLYYEDLQVRALPGVHEATLAAARDFISKDCKLLEIGSGTGALTRRLQDDGFDITASGIDRDDYRHVGTPFVPLDMSQPIDPQLRGTFGAAVATEVIEHVENIHLFFRNAHELLKAGGILILTTPNAASFFSRLQFLRSSRIAYCNEDLMRSWGHIQIIPEWMLRRAAECAGFECLAARGVGTRRYDLAPAWHRWADRLTPMLRPLIREDFDNQLRGSNLLMVLKALAR